MPPHTQSTKAFLIDVRSPAEFAAADGLPGAINIPHTSIDLLSADPRVDKNDDITLYCRSGRRSALALETLRESGFRRVRDIGGLEEASEVLRMEREKDGVKEDQGAVGRGDRVEREGDGVKIEGAEGMDKERLKNSTRTLLDGLRALE